MHFRKSVNVYLSDVLAGQHIFVHAPVCPGEAPVRPRHSPRGPSCASLPLAMSHPDQNIHDRATGAAAATVAQHQDAQPLVFYAGWVRAVRHRHRR